MFTGLSLLFLTLSWIWLKVCLKLLSEESSHKPCLSRWRSGQSVSDTVADSQFEFIFHVMQNTQTCYTVHTQTLNDQGFPHMINNMSLNKWHKHRIVYETCYKATADIGIYCVLELMRGMTLGVFRHWLMQHTLKPMSVPSASLVAMTRRAEQCLIIYGHTNPHSLPQYILPDLAHGWWILLNFFDQISFDTTFWIPLSRLNFYL